MSCRRNLFYLQTTDCFWSLRNTKLIPETADIGTMAQPANTHTYNSNNFYTHYNNNSNINNNNQHNSKIGKTVINMSPNNNNRNDHDYKENNYNSSFAGKLQQKVDHNNHQNGKQFEKKDINLSPFDKLMQEYPCYKHCFINLGLLSANGMSFKHEINSPKYKNNQSQEDIAKEKAIMQLQVQCSIKGGEAILGLQFEFTKNDIGICIVLRMERLFNTRDSKNGVNYIYIYNITHLII